MASPDGGGENNETQGLGRRSLAGAIGQLTASHGVLVLLLMAGIVDVGSVRDRPGPRRGRENAQGWMAKRRFPVDPGA